MKLRDNQTFVSPHFQANAVEIARGEADAFASVEDWERNTKQFGQVATPEAIADLMAKWVMSAKPGIVLDPSAGLGGLLAACQKFNHRVSLVGAELDAETFERAKASAPRGTKLILADYLKSDAGLFDGIIANPPYVKAHRLDYSEKDWRYFEELLGTPLDRLTNLYALFLLKIWEDLAPHGRAAVILPAEFLNANFGEEIKERLVRVIRPAALVVFAPSVNLFADALTTSAIVFIGKNRPANAFAWLKRADSLQEAESVVEKLCSNMRPEGNNGFELTGLNPREKWLNLLLNDTARSDVMPFPKHIGDYFRCRRGIATGANDYFCLSRAEMYDHDLTKSHVEPCITKAIDAEGLVFTRHKFDALADNDRRCFLLNPTQNGPALVRYLRLGEEQGIPKRHLPSHRPVWYLPENRAVADIWVAVFSRESVKFILNTSGAKNLTCFHGLYAKPGYEALPPLITLFLNSSGGRHAFKKVNRFYGDGLNKLEPKDVEAMPCPEMPKLSRQQAKELIQKLVEIEMLPASGKKTSIDKLAASYFDIKAAEPFSSPLDQFRSRHPAEQRRHHAARVSSRDVRLQMLEG